MTRRRDVLAGVAAIMAGAGITGASVAVPHRTDKALHDAIAQYLKATEERRGTAAAWQAAYHRAKMRYPAVLPKWSMWREANHPDGKYRTLPIGEDPSPRMRPLAAELEACPVDARGYKVIPKERDFLMRVSEAHVADEEDHYAQIRSVYDRLVAEREAAITAIDAEEGLPALDDADTAAYGRRDDAHDVLLACRPTTCAAFAIKAWICGALAAGVLPSAVPFPTEKEPGPRGLFLDQSEAKDARDVLAELRQFGRVRAVIDILDGTDGVRAGCRS